MWTALIPAFLFLSGPTDPALADCHARCSGGAYCRACSTCSSCAHCSAGGTCSVCRPDLYGGGGSSYEEAEPAYVAPTPPSRPRRVTTRPRVTRRAAVSAAVTPRVLSGARVMAARRLTERDLRKYTPKELTLLRNEPFARRGMMFSRPEINALFGLCAWYVPTTTDTAAVYGQFTPTERHNVTLIRKYQDRTGKRW